MSTFDDTTTHDITLYSDDKLLILNGKERLDYFAQKPSFKKTGFKQLLIKMIQKIVL